MNQNPNTETTVPQLFNDRSGEIMAQNDAAAVARATQEIQAALVVAKRFPRDEVKARSKILQACSRPGLADLAEYEYSRGGTKITGPSVDLLRAIASRWGNIRWGWQETERRDGMSMVRCWAWDMESNTPAERTFAVKHWRDTQGGGYALTDERDIYELLANAAARRVRACMEEVIDSDVIAEAVDACRATLRKTGGTVPLIDRVVKMVHVFQQEFGVTKEQIEQRLGNKAESCSENQLASLRRIYKSLKDGVGQPPDYFKPVLTSRPDLGSQPAAGTAVPQNGPSVAQTAPSVPETPPSDEEEERAMGLGPQTGNAADPEPEPPAAPVPTLPPAERPRRRTKAPAEASPRVNMVLAIRSLMNNAGVSEAELFAFLRTIDSDNGCTDLEGLEKKNIGVLTMVYNQFADVAERIKQMRVSQ